MSAIRAANKFLIFMFFPFAGLKMRENNDAYSILQEVRERSARKKCEQEVREARRIKILFPANLVFYAALSRSR
jgi:hypothetical protein